MEFGGRTLSILFKDFILVSDNATRPLIRTIIIIKLTDTFYSSNVPGIFLISFHIVSYFIFTIILLDIISASFHGFGYDAYRC